MNLNKVVQSLPQKNPFLMIDKVIEVEIPNRIVALKNVSNNEPFFLGHFPGNPIMPGVLITEAMAQTAAVFMDLSHAEQDRNGLYVLGMIKKMSFKQLVYPGDQLIIEVIAEKLLSTSAIVKARATVSEALVASGTLMFSRKDEN